MQFEEFQKQIQENVREFLGSRVTIETKEVIKNNGIRLHGMILFKEGYNVAPTVYLESFYEEFKQGRELGSIVLEIAKYCDEEHPVKRLDMKFFEKYEIVKKGIMIKLISREKNKELLERIPYIPFLNLAVIFYYSVVNEYIGNGSILIYNEHLEKWKLDIQTLYQNAFENTKQKLGYRIMDMRDVVRNLLKEQIAENINQKLEKEGNTENFHQDMEILMQQMEQALFASLSGDMFVLTNRTKNQGAVCMIYDEYLHSFAEKLEKNLFILPSSVHEVILIPDTGRENAQQLREMVEEVNTTQLEPEDVLSDSVYYYDRAARKTILLLP